MRDDAFDVSKNRVSGNHIESEVTSNKILHAIDKIQEIRAKNNKHWMNILRIAFKYAPQETEMEFKNVIACDAEIHEISKQLGEAK